MRYIDIPAKVIEGVAISSVQTEVWQYDDGLGDPYWQGGSTPQPYRWQLVLTVSEQQHSSHRTRKPYSYNGMDIKVGDYVAGANDGIAVKIISVESKSDSEITCTVEDVVRYNMFRDQSRQGNGLFSVPGGVVVFEVNEDGIPVVDPIPPGGVSTSFFSNLLSRFQNLEETKNFYLEKPNHGFKVDDLIAADPLNHTFVKASPAHPFLIGTVSYNYLGPNAFMVNPIQKIVDNFDHLVGDVGEVLYVDSQVPGGLSTVGTHPVMVKLRNNGQSSVHGSVSPATTSGFSFTLNGKLIILPSGDIDDFCSAINEYTFQHGVTAVNSPVVTEMESDAASLASGEPLAFVGGNLSAIINGTEVFFTSNAYSTTQVGYGPTFSVEEDMAFDINSAGIENIFAIARDNSLVIQNVAGGEITISNGGVDANGSNFAGSNSVSGLPLYVPASTERRVVLTAVDARAIDLFDIDGSATADFGLTSTESGQKAAALYIEQGIRQAATYVVADIAARDAINAMFGDQCFVQDKGNGEWGHYIRTLENIWVKVADKDSSESDAQTVEIEIDHTSTSDTIYTVSGGSRVTFVTVTVTEQFNGLNPTLSVGDADDNARLMTDDQNDLTSLGAYSTTPSYIYSGSQDVDITFTFDAANSTSGKAVIAISYT